jgi:hypothetical protein
VAIESHLRALLSKPFTPSHSLQAILSRKNSRLLLSSKRNLSNRRDSSDTDDNDNDNDDILSHSKEDLIWIQRWKMRASSVSESLQSIWSQISGLISDKAAVFLRNGGRRKTDHDTALSPCSTAARTINESNTMMMRSSSSSNTTNNILLSGMAFPVPAGPRWAVSHPDIDLSGTWKPTITADFLQQYDEYLTNCGTSYFFRQLCLKCCGMTRETITQLDRGRRLELDGQTPAGSWKRCLISSGAEPSQQNDYQVEYAEFLDPDKEMVQVEAWWEDQGRVHRSILRNKPTVQGGEFETLRYLMSDDDAQNDNNTKGESLVATNDTTATTAAAATTLVTESTFRPKSPPSNNKFKPAQVRWEYTRVS